MPVSPKGGDFRRIEETGGREPPQKGGEIREQLDGLSGLDGAGIEEIEGQLISEEKEPCPAIGLASSSAPVHVPPAKKTNTYN